MEKTVNRYQMAKNCMERISKDFKQIKSEHIDKGDYEGAFKKLYVSLGDSHYDSLKPEFAQFYEGGTFCAMVDILSEALKKGYKSGIELSSNALLACIRQQELREKTGSDNEI